MKFIITFLMIVLCIGKIIAQADGSLSIKGGEKIFYLHKWVGIYSTKLLDRDSHAIILPNWLIDTSIYAQDLNLAPTLVILDTTNSELPLKEKFAKFTIGFGLSVGNYLEFNNTDGTGNKNSFSLNGSLDLGYTYKKPKGIFSTTNELHYTIGVQKESLTSTTELQRAQDDIQTLHDIGFAFTKKHRWKMNLIAKSATSIFTIFDNNYFKDVSGNGRIQSVLSPFSLILSPGIQYQPIEPLRISLSPYSTELYGVTSDKISSKGIFITDTNDSGNYEKLITKRQALEFNIWFDYRIKEWFEMQYRLGIYSNYQKGFSNNAVVEGLFISKIKLIKNLYLSHRATLNSDLFINLSSPFFTQNIQINYTIVL